MQGFQPEKPRLASSHAQACGACSRCAGWPGWAHCCTDQAAISGGPSVPPSVVPPRHDRACRPQAGRRLLTCPPCRLPRLQGRPIFAFSTMSPHTADVRKDPRCSLTVLAEPFRVRRRRRNSCASCCLVWSEAAAQLQCIVSPCGAAGGAAGLWGAAQRRWKNSVGWFS